MSQEELPILGNSVNETNEPFSDLYLSDFPNGMMSSNISFKDFLNLVDNTYNDHSFTWRYGQTIMNLLHGVWPEKYQELIDSDMDCYYNDKLASKILQKLKTDWSDT